MLHIFNFIRKYWIIIAIVILYFFLAGINFLPRGLNIFKKKNLLIDETPVVVKEIRELGELTTSEFFGEVYADLNEVYDDLLNNKIDSVKLDPSKYFRLYSGLKEYMDNSGEYRVVQLTYNSESERYDKALNEHIASLNEYNENEKSLREQIAENKGNRKERKKLEKRLNELSKNLELKKENLKDAKKRFDIAKDKFDDQKETYWKNKKRRNLVYIGRGWVKAGVDLKDISEEDIILDDDDSSSIEIVISDPVILDADINPWFIYTDEKQVKGFEVFLAKTGSMLSESNFTDVEVTELKRKCKTKLTEDAMSKGIINNAKSSAIQTLENFFRLVGFNKVKVRFRSSTLVVVKEE